MGFYYRIAPDIRVRVSGRGVRASLGPRYARAHVGGGPTGASSGAGPITYYRSFDNRSQRRKQWGNGFQPTTGPYGASQRQAVDPQKLAEANRIVREVEELCSLHHRSFDPLRKPSAEVVKPASMRKVTRQLRAEARKGISVFDRGARRAAAAQVRKEADEAHQAAIAEAARQTAANERTLDEWWELVLSNDEKTLLPILEEAFADNAAPAVAVGVEGPIASLIVVVPPIEVLPDRVPAVTTAGNLTIKAMPKRQRVEGYNDVIAGLVLVTLKKTFANGPALGGARIIAVRDDGPNAYGKPAPVCLLAGEWKRASFEGLVWTTEASQILNETASHLEFKQRGRTKELVPLDLDRHPDLKRVVEAAALDETLPTKPK